MTRQSMLIAVLCAALLASPARAVDVWDQATEDDNSSATDNTLVHGSIQEHDLGNNSGVEDEDWFLVSVPSRSSYEVVVDGATGDINLVANSMTLYDADGSTLLRSSSAVGTNTNARRIAWINATPFTQSFFIRVGNADCTTDCTSNDQYTIRARDTTIALVRFNNSATQVSVLMAQNSSQSALDAEVYFWSPTGTLLATHPIALVAKNLSVVALPGIPALAGLAGSITIAHTGHYASLNSKVVALEPATGFSFDTPGVIKP